jgi:hypothetical protein
MYLGISCLSRKIPDEAPVRTSMTGKNRRAIPEGYRVGVQSTEKRWRYGRFVLSILLTEMCFVKKRKARISLVKITERY